MGSENALGDVPEDDSVLSTSGQFSASCGGANEKPSTAQQPSQGQTAAHYRGAAGTQAPFVVSADDVAPVLGGEHSLPSVESAQPRQSQEESCAAAPRSRVKACSGPLQPTGGSMEAMGVDSGGPLRRSHEATVRRLDAAIEQFGREKQGYDLVGVAKAMVGFEKMCIEVRLCIFSCTTCH